MSSPSPQNPGLLNWALIMSLGLIWGGAFMSVRLSLDGFGPWTVSAGRTLIAAICLSLIGFALRQGVDKVPAARGLGFCAVIGVCAVALPIAMLTQGQQHVPSAFAGVAMGAVPLLVLPLAYVFSPEEGIGPRRIIGMVLGFIGLIILIGPGATTRTGSDHETMGRLACLAAAGCYAAGSLMTRRAPAMPAITFAATSLIFAASVLLPIALIIEGWPQDFPLVPSLALLYAAFLPTALAAIIRVRVITTAGSVFMSLTSYMVPVWAVILGVTFMNETLPPQIFVALGIILAGIGLSQSRELAAMFRR